MLKIGATNHCGGSGVQSNKTNVEMLTPQTLQFNRNTDKKRNEPIIQKHFRNYSETLKLSCVVCMRGIYYTCSVAPIKGILGLLVWCAKRLATHSPTRGCGLWGYPQPLRCARHDVPLVMGDYQRCMCGSSLWHNEPGPFKATLL